ncbi:MAG: hypothetical protein J0H89_07430, partial [Rhizobiales bacterium]|nr:hypothetical protein [Hyphomicrobiales bacterium]
DDNADSYWERSDLFDMALDLTGGRRGLAALAQAMTRWLSHLLAVDVTIEPVTELRDAKFNWYVGLDTDATRIGDRLWNGDALDENAASRIIGLFRLFFHDKMLVSGEVKDDPVYLIMAMTPEKLLRMKPQNLVTGLPIVQREAAT